MPNGEIAQVQLPNGTVYDIKDATARAQQLTATYTSATLDLELVFDTAENADSEEF